MKSFAAATNIKAPSEVVWGILTDAPNYPGWDPGVERIEGKIAKGEKIVARTKLAPGRAFPVTVSEFIPGKNMTWSGGMPLGLFKGERTFNLEPKKDGSTDFSVREEFSGILLPLIGRTLPDLDKAFTEFAAGLKARAEQG